MTDSDLMQKTKHSSRFAMPELHSLISGFLIGIPISYPHPPYYLIAGLVFASSFVYVQRFNDYHKFLIVIFAIIVALLSNVFAPFPELVDWKRAIYTSFYFLLFLFGNLVPNQRLFLKGFCASVSLQSFAIVALAIYRKIHTGGLYLFTVPQLRLWGADVFPDWPNYIAFFIIIAFLLNLTLFRKPVSAAFNLTAAIATTSRTPVLGLIIFTLFSLNKNKARLIKAAIFFSATLAVFIVFANFNQEFKNRILLMSDRNTIYKYGLALISESPLLGMGSVLFDKSVGHVGFASFHNTYLDIAVRHGLVGLAFFLVLTEPFQFLKNKSKKYFLAILFLFLVGSVFQNFLKHPHLVMIFSVMTVYLTKSRNGDLPNE